MCKSYAVVIYRATTWLFLANPQSCMQSAATKVRASPEYRKEVWQRLLALTRGYNLSSTLAEFLESIRECIPWGGSIPGTGWCRIEASLRCTGRYRIDSILRGANPSVRQRVCSQLWQPETSSFLHLMSYSSTNCKNAQLSYWRGRSSTRKIKEEASQKDQADQTGRGGHRSAIWRTGHAADRANRQWPQVYLCHTFLHVARVKTHTAMRDSHRKVYDSRMAVFFFTRLSTRNDQKVRQNLMPLATALERQFKNKLSWAIGEAGGARGKLRRRLRKRIRRMESAEEDTEWNGRCWKNLVHLGVCLVLPIEAIADRKLPTTSWYKWGDKYCMFRFMWKWHNKRKSACETLKHFTLFRISHVLKQWTGIFKVSQAFHPFQNISCSKAMDWNFQSVKYLDELVQQSYCGRKRGGRNLDSKCIIPRKESKGMSNEPLRLAAPLQQRR